LPGFITAASDIEPVVFVVRSPSPPPSLLPTLSVAWREGSRLFYTKRGALEIGAGAGECKLKKSIEFKLQSTSTHGNSKGLHNK
jgi:hypothetical protein